MRDLVASPRLNPLISAIPEYASKRISERARNDPDVIGLSIGEPWFGPPKRFSDFARSLASSDELAPLVATYAESRGLPQMREAVAERYQRLYRLDVDPHREILITNGAVEAVWLALLVCSDVGDEVLIADPTYTLYEPLARFLGRIPVRLAPQPGSFGVTSGAIAERLSSRGRVVILNSPENPTGLMCEREPLAELTAFARAHDLVIVHDEVYDAFAPDHAHVPALAVGREISVMVNSFSKKYGMPGWRLGWMVAPPALIEAAVKTHNYFALSCPGITQQVGAQLLRDEDTETELRANAEEVARRVRWLADELVRVPGLALPRGLPPGGMFLFLNVAELFPALGRRLPFGLSAGEAAAHLLLSECKLAVVPGIAYGSAGADYVRVLAAAPWDALECAVERVRTLVGAHEA